MRQAGKRRLWAVLPKVLTTTIKIAYKSVLDDPGTKLDQNFTQAQLAEIVWDDEAQISQTIVTKMLGFMDGKDLIDSLIENVRLDAIEQRKIEEKRKPSGSPLGFQGYSSWSSRTRC